MPSVPDIGYDLQGCASSNGNDNETAAVSISFEELADKIGLNEDTLLQRIAAVLCNRTDDKAAEVVSARVAE